MNCSLAARRQLIEIFEGLRETAYRDSAGVFTIGYGHTSMAGAPPVTPGMKITQAQAAAILSRDLEKVENGVTKLLREPPLQREFDALVDFAFNAGLGALRSSSVLRLFNRGDKKGAAQAFLAWDRCRGRALAGLERRRAAERAWFLGLTPGEPAADFEMAHAVDRPDPIGRRAVNRVALALKRRQPA